MRISFLSLSVYLLYQVLWRLFLLFKDSCVTMIQGRVTWLRLSFLPLSEKAYYAVVE